MDDEKIRDSSDGDNVVYLQTFTDELDAVIHKLGVLVDNEYNEILEKYEYLEERTKFHKIPQNLDTSIKEMCKDAAKEKKKQLRKRIVNQLSKVCAIVLIMVIVTFTAFAPQAEAMRLKLYELIIEPFDGHVGIEFVDDEDILSTIVDNVMNEEEYALLAEAFDLGEEILYPEKMFEGFNLYKVQKTLNDYDLYFKNDADRYILVQVYDGSTKMYPDSEQSKLKDIMINNQSALLRESEERFYIYYYVDSQTIEMSFDKFDISIEDVIMCAESIKKLKI